MEQILGTTKVCDGLYIGDEFSSKDIDTIVMNHITHIVNLSSKQVANSFQNHGITYLNMNFIDSDKNKDKEKQIVLDPNDLNVSRIIQFIEQTREQGQSILIHGLRSYTTGIVFYCAYLMLRYRWGLYKTIEFLESRVNKLHLNNSLIRQLRGYQSRIITKIEQSLSIDWNLYDGMQLEELTLRNTYMNSFLKADNYKFPQIKNSIKTKVSWRDQNQSTTSITNLKKGQIKSILKNQHTGKMHQIERTYSKQKKQQVWNYEVERKSMPHSREQSQKRFVQRQSEKGLKILKKQQQPTNMRSQSPISRTRNAEKKQAQWIKPSPKNKKQNNNQNNLYKNQQSKYPPFNVLFKSSIMPQKQQLNKSQGVVSSDRAPLHVRFDTDNSSQKEKQPSKESLREQVAKKLLKKMILEKGSSLASLQNKENGNQITKKRDNLTKIKCESQVVLQKAKKNLYSQRTSQDARKQRQSSTKRTMVNNFVKEKSSNSRPQSPVIKKSQTKINVQKINASLQTKTQIRGQSPASSQNRISLKDASTLLNSIFPHHNYRPKWKH